MLDTRLSAHRTTRSLRPPKRPTCVMSVGLGVPSMCTAKARGAIVVLLSLFVSGCDSGTARGQVAAHPPSAQRAGSVGAAGVKRDVAVRAYDLVVNPFQYQGQVVVLDPLSFPFVSQGAVFSWQRSVEAVGRTGLRFKRIWSDGEALYDVMAVDVGPGASDLKPIGQLVVVLPHDRPHAAPSGAEPLPLNTRWMVKAQGVVEATNAVGAPVQIPIVKICYTKACDDAPGATAPPPPPPPPRSTLPIIAPYDLVIDPYLHRGQKVLLDFTTASAVNAAGHRPWPDSGLGLRFSKMLDAQTGVYEIIGMDLDRWRGGLRAVGQLVVLLPSDWRQRLACPPGMPDAGPICITGAQWVVEPAGPYQGLNALGALVQVPSVRFVAKSTEYQTWQSDPTLSDIQKGIFAAHKAITSQPAPGRATSCYAPAPGAPCITIAPPPREEDFDTRIAWRDALDAWRAQREELMHQADAAWANPSGGGSSADAHPASP